MKKFLLFISIAVFFLYSCENGANESSSETSLEVEIGVTNETPAMGEPVSFYLKVKVGSRITSAEWNFGDGSTSPAITVEHSFVSEGSYRVSVKATNEAGATAENVKTITVKGNSLLARLKHFDRNRVWLCAHRCNTGDVSIPENSITALEKCIAYAQAGVLEMVEIDPRPTKDGVIVIMHDKTVNRTTNGSGNVSDLTYAQIRTLRLKLPDGTLTQDTVPTLRSFLEVAKGKVFVDLDFLDKVPTLDMYNEVKACGMLDEVMFYTAANSSAITSLLSYSPAAIPCVYMNKASQAAEYSGQAIYIAYINATNVLTTSLTTDAAVAGLVSFTNTLVQDGITIDNDIKNNDYSGVDLMLNKGINVLQTDQSPLLNAYLKTKNKR